MRRIFRNCILGLVAAAFICAGAFPGDVEFQVQEHEGWVGSPITMTITVVNSTGESQPPEIVANPDFTGAVVGSPQRMEVRKNFNGVNSRSTTTTWTVHLTPKRVGKLTLPHVKMVVDGRTWQSPLQMISVSPSDSGEVLAVTVKSNPSTLYVGQAANLILEIAIRPYSSREPEVTLSERQMWELIDVRSSSWGVFEPRMRDLAQNNQRPSGREELRDGEKWCIYEIVSNTNATKSGALDVGDVRIDLRYPTGIAVDRDFFGSPQLSISGIRRLSASPDPSKVVVKALPEAGRPASFRGAVGQFTVQAFVKPEKAAVGDPMTLTFSVKSLSDNIEELRALQPPPLEDPALVQRFRMPTDPLAGTVIGSTKTFTQTLRPLSADVKEIPPIEFSYFDPSTAKYATVSTKAIPILVSPAERISPTAMEGAVASKKDAAKTNLTEVDGGLFANAAPSAELVVDQRLSFSWGTGLAFAAPPLLAFALLLIRKRSHAAKSNVGLARSRSAARSARRKLEQTQDVAAIARTIQEFIEARAGRPAGTVTRSDAKSLAKAAGANDSSLQTLDSILALGERAAFAPQRGESARESREQAVRLIDALDRLAWRRKTASILEEIAP